MGSYKDTVTIKQFAESNGDEYIVITSDSDIGEIDLYCAVYKSDGGLVNVQCKAYTINAGDTRIDITKPAVVDGEAYKLMLWDCENNPVIEAIQ